MIDTVQQLMELSLGSNPLLWLGSSVPILSVDGGTATVVVGPPGDRHPMDQPGGCNLHGLFAGDAVRIAAAPAGAAAGRCGVESKKCKKEQLSLVESCLASAAGASPVGGGCALFAAVERELQHRQQVAFGLTAARYEQSCAC
eukprot:gene32495-29721_t